MSRFVLRTLSILCFLFAVLVVPLRAQFRAAVQGTVTDASGGVVSDAAVTITSNETQKSQTFTTGPDGFYRFTGLQPGTYAVAAEKQGFQKTLLDHVQVNAEQAQGVDLQLQTGQMTESVTVTENVGAQLETENANISRAITTEEVRALPQIGRDPYELLRTAPGIFGNGARSGSGQSVGMPNSTGPGGSNSSIFQTENQVAISANGQRVSDNNFLIDGVSVNSLTYGGAAVVTPNQESVKQIRVSANAYSAEYGRNSGAQIETVSQNGTNLFHGSGVFKLNSPSLNAYDKYGGPNGAPLTRVNNLYRQYAASVGGPIIKNRLFFFFSYEGLRSKSTGYANAYLETPAFRQAVISARPNSLIAQVLGSAGMQPRVVATIPLTQCPGGLTNCQVVNGALDIGTLNGATGQYTATTNSNFAGVPFIEYAQIAVPQSSDGNQYNFRVDYQHGNDTAALSSYITHRNDVGSDPSAGARPAADVYNAPVNSLYTLTYSRVLSPTLLNEIRANFTRFAFNQVTASSATNWGIPRIEVEGLPFDRIRFGAPQSESTPGIFAENTFEVRDYVSKIAGRHALRGGFEVRWEQDNNNLNGGARPLYSFTGLFNLANQTPVFEQINANPATGGIADAQRYFRTKDYGIFVQDDWKVTPSLTLNFGLRWEYFTPLREKNGQIYNLVFGSQGLANSRIVQQSELYRPDRNNFAPRVAFAYSPNILNKNVVVRGGFGVFFDRIPEVLFANSRGNPPNFARYGLCCGNAGSPFANGQIDFVLGSSSSPFSYPANPALATGINPATGSPLGASVEIYGAQPNLPNPYTYVMSFDVEYKLPWSFITDLGYQGSSTHKQIRLVNLNFLYPNNPAFYAVYFPQPDVNGNYNGLLWSVRRNVTQSIQFSAQYRWSKSIDTLSNAGPGAVTNQTYPQNLSSERGPSDYDARHYLEANAVYRLPFVKPNRVGLAGALLGGWQVSPIVTFHTGFPWTPKIGQSVNTPGGPSLGPIRPTQYLGGAGTDTSNQCFITGCDFVGGGAKYFNITATGPPGIGRNVFRGPHFFQTDMSLAKQTKLPWIHLGETANLELRANAYNVFNQLNLAPFGFYSQGTFADNQFFGRADTALSGRVIELQARFSF
jgi:hypothetical protein